MEAGMLVGISVERTGLVVTTSVRLKESCAQTFTTKVVPQQAQWHNGGQDSSLCLFSWEVCSVCLVSLQSPLSPQGITESPIK